MKKEKKLKTEGIQKGNYEKEKFFKKMTRRKKEKRAQMGNLPPRRPKNLILNIRALSGNRVAIEAKKKRISST